MSTDPVEGELVEVHGGLPVRLPADPFAPIEGLHHTWNLTEEGGASRLAKCLRPADFDIADVDGVTMTIEHVLAHVVNLVDQQTGEVTMAMRLVLVTVDGKTFSCVSPVALGSVAILAAVYGPPPWPGGRKVVARRIITRSKRTTITLEPEG